MNNKNRKQQSKRKESKKPKKLPIPKKPSDKGEVTPEQWIKLNQDAFGEGLDDGWETDPFEDDEGGRSDLNFDR